jgi:hypothetical protein
MPTKPGLEVVPAPTWHGRLMQPARRLLLRLIAPMLGRVLTANDELWASHQGMARQLEETQRRLDLLTEEIAAANALAWDQVALARRLSELEDQLAAEHVRPDAGDAQRDSAAAH